MAISTLYEDDDLLAVDKPAGMVVHPTYRNQTGTLLQAVTSPAVPRPSIVGRLDKWTSGIVLFVKSPEAHAAMQRTLASPDTHKEYLAIAAAEVDEREGTIDVALKLDPADRRRVVVADDGAASITEFRRLATFHLDGGALSLLRCRPRTGRRHQIRVHLAHRGWPLLGDRVYGHPPSESLAADPRIADALARFGGQALHAWRLAFLHPVARQFTEIKSPLPDTFEPLLTLLSYEVIL